MPELTAAAPRICLLDAGYAREARALLCQAYHHEPTYAWLLEQQRPGYERRLRVVVREWLRQHFYLQLPAIGLLLEDRLIGLALIAPPQRRLGVADSWAWRLRMILGAGLRCTRRYLDYQGALAACLPSDKVHVLPLLGLHPDFREQQHAEQLLQAVHDWCAEDAATEGVVLDTGNPHYLPFYQQQGYEELGEVAIGPVRERVFYHPHPQSSRPATA